MLINNDEILPPPHIKYIKFCRRLYGVKAMSLEFMSRDSSRGLSFEL